MEKRLEIEKLASFWVGPGTTRFEKVVDLMWGPKQSQKVKLIPNSKWIDGHTQIKPREFRKIRRLPDVRAAMNPVLHTI